MELWCIIYTFCMITVIRGTQSLRIRRGFGGGGHAGLSNLGGYAPGYGSGPAGQAAGYAALQEIANYENIAFWSAQSAVASAVAQDYRHQQATTAQLIHQFTVPVTKSQASKLFGGGKGHERYRGGNRQGGHGGNRNSHNGHNRNPWRGIPGGHRGQHRGGGGGGGAKGGGGRGGGGGGHGHGRQENQDRPKQCRW